MIIYDAEADTWETGPPLPSPCYARAATTIDGGIVLHSNNGEGTMAGGGARLGGE